MNKDKTIGELILETEEGYNKLKNEMEVEKTFLDERQKRQQKRVMDVLGLETTLRFLKDIAQLGTISEVF